MAEAYYFDTSIWIDIYDKRGLNGKVAKDLMEKIILDDSIIIYSDATIIELKKVGFSEYERNTLFQIAKPDNIRRVHTSKDQIEQARKIARKRNVPWRDALHAVLATENNARLVSRDQDFEKLKDIILAKKPEDLLDT